MKYIVDPEGGGTDRNCPRYHAAIELIGRRWNGVILQNLLGGPLRFSQLRERIPGVTDAMLSQRLKELENAAIVNREVSTGRPIEIRYGLTPVGQELGPVLTAVATWSVSWAEKLGR